MTEQEKEAQLFANLLHKMAPQSKFIRHWPLQGGISAQMIAFELLQSDGQIKKMIRRSRLRRDRSPSEIQDSIAREFKTLQLMQSLGIATPTPYYLELSGELFATSYFVMEYIEGQPEYLPAQMAPDSAFQMATLLAKIHRINSSTHDLSFLPQQRAKHVTSTSLLHGDFWPGNMLWKAGKLVAVIDWEDAKIGDPLEDLAITRFDLLFIFGIEVMNQFTECYQAISRADFSTLPYWDLYAARRAASGIAEWGAGWAQLGRADLTENVIREAHQWFIRQAEEKI